MSSLQSQSFQNVLLEKESDFKKNAHVLDTMFLDFYLHNKQLSTDTTRSLDMPPF